MQDPPAVAVAEAPQELEQEQPHVPGAEAARILLEVLRQVRVLKRTDGENTELFKNIPAKFPESTSKCSAAHPKNALGQNISASHS